MEACGILTPPPELPQQQQMAFDFLPHLNPAEYDFIAAAKQSVEVNND